MAMLKKNINNQSLIIAKRMLLTPGGVTKEDLEKTLSLMMSYRLDYADLYLQQYYAENLELEDQIVKTSTYAVEHGVGVRAVVDDKTGFAFSNDITLSALKKAARMARSISKKASLSKIKHCKSAKNLKLYPPTNPVISIKENEKVALMQTIDQTARAIDPRVSQVNVELSASYEVILIVASDGTYAADVRPLVRLGVRAMVEQNDRREVGYYGGGQRAGYEIFQDKKVLEQYARESVREALINLEAVDAPAGLLPVVLGAGWPAVILHEAIGHGLEGDFIRKGSSAFTNKIGQRVASPGCTIVDDGTLEGRRGSLSIDDEGVLPQCTVLIEDGILKKYMLDKLSARLMKMNPTGNGRRETYAHIPLPRMTNTYMLPGNYSSDEIIGSVKKGIYVVNLGGGQVDITSGKFVFSTTEAYLIENGKISTPIKNATLIGHGPDILTKVSMIGNQLKLDNGAGTCGKDGQSIPVGVGQPMIKIDEMTVGGTTL